MFTVMALFYGDYPGLAAKLLNSLSPQTLTRDFRFGLNDVSTATAKVVNDWVDKYRGRCPITVYQPSENAGKYPLMRVMLRDTKTALGSHIMWFDDDSYLDVKPAWWDNVADLAVKHIQVGSVHRIKQRGRQWEMIPKQPWYRGKPVNSGTSYIFATGGWWVLRSDFVLEHDYPFPALFHNGGDSMLGELLRQHGHKPFNFVNGARCGCESCSKSKPKPKVGNGHVMINVGGRKGRRGLGRTSENYVWSNGNEPELQHQSFVLKISRWL